MQVSVFRLDPKGVDPDLEESNLVGGSPVLCPFKPWTGDEGPLWARLLLSVPVAGAGRLGVEARTDTHLEAALLAVMLEGTGLCLGTPSQIDVPQGRGSSASKPSSAGSHGHHKGALAWEGEVFRCCFFAGSWGHSWYRSSPCCRGKSSQAAWCHSS